MYLALESKFINVFYYYYYYYYYHYYYCSYYNCLCGFRDAEEAMLAAAIRASLVEAGEPDTSMQSASASSPHQQPHAAGTLKDQQQDSLLVPVPSSSVTQQAAGSLQDQQQLQGQRQQQYGGQPQQQQHHQHSQQQQQQQQQYGQQQQQQQAGHDHQQQGLPHGLGVSSGFDAAAYQFGGMAAALQGTALSKGQSQGSSQQGLEQAKGIQMRPSWSSSALMQAECGEAEPLVSAASTPADGTCSFVLSFVFSSMPSSFHPFLHPFVHSYVHSPDSCVPLESSAYSLSWSMCSTSKALHHEHILLASGSTSALCRCRPIRFATNSMQL